MLRSVPQVDVIPDGFDWANVVFGSGGLLVALVAIVIAIRAQKTADLAVTEERRRLFEIDVLRQILRDLEETELVAEVFQNPSRLARYAFRLKLLTCQLPFWELVSQLPDSRAVVDAVGLGAELRAAQEAVTSATSKQGRALMLMRAFADQQVDHEGTLGEDRQFTQWTKYMANRIAVSNEKTMAELKAKPQKISDAAAVRLGEKLAYDVQQAILTQIEARRWASPSFWNGWRSR